MLISVQSACSERMTAVKRQYHSVRRREQSQATRRRIIDAARDLFLERGYGRTTLATVAQRASVSVETVYGAFGNKRSLLRQVWYVAFRGDEEDTRLLRRPEILAVLAEPDLAVRFRAHAAVMTAVFRRMTPILIALRGAASSEPDAAAILAEFDAGRLEAAATYARAAAATGQLVVSEADCQDLLWATLDGTLWQRLVTERGWSDERFAAWLGETWTAAFVRPQEAGAR